MSGPQPRAGTAFPSMTTPPSLPNPATANIARRPIRRRSGRWRWCQKPLFWFGRKLRYLLRAFGLRALNCFTLLRHEPEHPKHVLQTSFWIALSRCAVHLTPITVFILLSYVNLKTVYIGPGFSVNDRYDSVYLTFFQVAAKTQELFCLASMGTILLQLLRHDMLYGYGTPLGLVSVHLSFSQPSSLLSPDYLAALFESLRQAWRLSLQLVRGRSVSRHVANLYWVRTRLVLLVLAMVLLAVFIGPFTAVLLIPRSRTFPAGGTRYNLDASAEELWPSVVDVDLEYEACSWSNATMYPVCPSGGYSSLRNQRAFNTLYEIGWNPPMTQADSTLEDENSLVYDPEGIVPAVLGKGVINDIDFTVASWACSPNLYSVVILQTLVRDWNSAAWDTVVRAKFLASTPEFKYALVPSASASTTYPMAQVRCTQPQNLSRDAAEAEFRFIRDASIMPYGWSDSSTTKTVHLSGLQLDPTTHLRAQWLPLSIEDIGPVSAGLLLELPWSQASGTRLAVTCTVVASWAQGSIARVRGSDYTAWHVGYDLGQFDLKISLDLGPNDPAVALYQRHIQFTKQWLDFLTPEAPDPFPTTDSWRPTTLENIFALAGFDTLIQDLRTRPRYIPINETCAIGVLDTTLSDLDLWAADVCSEYPKNDYIEWTVARLVSDGLSRRLSHRAFDTTPDLRSWITNPGPHQEDYNSSLLRKHKDAMVLSNDSDLVVQRLVVEVEGLGYRISTTTEYLAMVVVGAYLLLSSSHVLWTLTHRRTSSSWDTATELLLLAWNSPSSSALRATSAQVHRWRTYNRVIKIRAESVNDNTVGTPVEMHLRMLVDNHPGDTEATQQDTKDGIAIPLASTSSVSTSSQDDTPERHSYQLVKEGQKYY